MQDSNIYQAWDIRPENVGILAIEVYFPSTFVTQEDLESFYEVAPGKYTKGLNQIAMGFTGDREDINSITLTCVSQLMEKYKIDPKDIGRLEVGTETLVDKSKSTKTVLMSLFKESGNTNIEGVTTINACYGGTAALFNSVAWVESSAWDGRYALVVIADIAVYAEGSARPTSGCGAVALLIGPNSPLVLESRTRTTHSDHIWDFYKPDPLVEFPTVDGHHSQDCYLRALDGCYLRFLSKTQQYSQYQCRRDGQSTGNIQPTTLESMDFAIFHSPYNKLVQKAFARLKYLDAYRSYSAALTDESLTFDSKYEFLLPFLTTPIEDTYSNRSLDLAARNVAANLYKTMTEPYCAASQVIGNCYAASVYLNLADLIYRLRSAGLENKSVLVFSYGSGSMASMFSIRTTTPLAKIEARFSLDNIAEILQLDERLAARRQCTPDEFHGCMSQRERLHGQKSIKPIQPIESLRTGTFYLVQINEKYQREYAQYLHTCSSLASPCPIQSNIETPITKTLKSISWERKGAVQITATSVTLPGETTDDNINTDLDKLLRGINCIHQLDETAIASLISKNVVVNTRGQNAPKKIHSKEECIKVAGILTDKSHSSSLSSFGITESLIKGMDETTQLAVAAGLNAMSLAGLISRTKNWVLPESLQNTTGIIYGSSFPVVSTIIKEVSDYFEKNNDYTFDRKLLFKLLVTANAQIAQITKAKGPNLQLNSACVSTTAGLVMAMDWIKIGKCQRVVVVGCDTGSSQTLLPWLGSGFRILNAASIASCADLASCPFDKRRNGMVMSAGAASFVVEKNPFVIPKLIDSKPRVYLLASHMSNSAYHGASMDVNHITQELETFMETILTNFSITKEEFALNGVYYAHETGTHATPTGSCAYIEITALRNVFGSDLLAKLLVTNTKGFTGHPMGVSFEDIAAVEGLRAQVVPPVVNHEEPDPLLSPTLGEANQSLNLSKGGNFSHRYAIRFAAGFGSQVALTFYTVEL